MTGFTDFVQTELPKRPFTNTDGAPGQMLVRSSNTAAARELVWVDVPSGGGSVVTYIAGEAISGHSALIVGADGKLYNADCGTAAHQFVFAVAVGASASGAAVSFVDSGPLEHLGWTFTPGLPVFLGHGGLLTQTLPVDAVFSKIIGIALTSTKISISFQPAIFL